jgi:hypothetical protein
MKTPEDRPLPQGWVRSEQSGITILYSPPTLDVCKTLTDPDFELPEGVIEVRPKKGFCRHRGGREVMVFTVEND